MNGRMKSNTYLYNIIIVSNIVGLAYSKSPWAYSQIAYGKVCEPFFNYRFGLGLGFCVVLTITIALNPNNKPNTDLNPNLTSTLTPSYTLTPTLTQPLTITLNPIPPKYNYC